MISTKGKTYFEGERWGGGHTSKPRKKTTTLTLSIFERRNFLTH